MTGQSIKKKLPRYGTLAKIINDPKTLFIYLLGGRDDGEGWD